MTSTPTKSISIPLREKAKIENALANKNNTGEEAQSRQKSLFGKPMLAQFPIDPSFRNLNHGSFGSIPNEIQSKLRTYQSMAEARPDPFIRYEYPKLLDESRAAVAKLLRVPVDTVVFVNNATVGVNTVLKALVWDAGCRDEILYFSTVYAGCGKTIDYVVDSGYGRVSSRCVDITYPIEDDEIVARFRAVVQTSREEGKRPRICVFDVVTSMPGVRFPFEDVTAACRELEVLSLIDGAQGIGMVDLDLGLLDPDFFVTNCHKWLHVPRGCAAFYVPIRNQALIRSSLATSHGYVPKSNTRFNPLPPSSKSRFVNEFEFVGTIDNSPYLCVKDSIRWREEVLGGEEKILEYQQKLAKEGGQKVAEILGTKILENSKGTLTDCAMINIALPLVMAADAINGDVGKNNVIAIPREDAAIVFNWMLQALMDEYKTFIALLVHGDRWWARLSAQVYLDMEDFEWAGETLRDLCARVGRGEYANAPGPSGSGTRQAGG